MRDPMEGVHYFLTGPGRSSKLDRRPLVLVESQQTAGRVLNIFQQCKIAGQEAVGNETMPPKFVEQFYITGNELTKVSWYTLYHVNNSRPSLFANRR